MANRKEFDRPGHFIVADSCRFFRHTHVGQWCISTVGDYHPKGIDREGPAEIGCNRLFETFVFNTRSKTHRWMEVEGIGSNSRIAAGAAHEKMVRKYQRIVDAKKRKDSRR